MVYHRAQGFLSAATDQLHYLLPSGIMVSSLENARQIPFPPYNT